MCVCVCVCLYACVCTIRGFLSPRHGVPSGCGWGSRPPDMEGG